MVVHMIKRLSEPCMVAFEGARCHAGHFFELAAQVRNAAVTEPEGDL